MDKDDAGVNPPAKGLAQMMRFFRWFFCLLFITGALLALPSYAQSPGPLVLQADSSRFPQIAVTVTLPCSALTDTERPVAYQIQEDGLPVPIRAPESFTATKRTETIILLDLWQGSAPYWDELKANLLASLLDSKKLANGQDTVAIFVPGKAGKELKQVLKMTNDGGQLHNDMIAQTVQSLGVKNLKATALISLTRQLLPVFDQTGAAAKSLVIFSDGADPLSKGLLRQLTDESSAQDVKIYTVFVPDSRQDKELLDQLANVTVENPVDFTQKSTLDSLWKKTLSADQQMCRFTYRTQQSNPTRLTLHSQLLDRAQQPVAYTFAPHTVSLPQVQITEPRPGHTIEQGVQSKLRVTFTTSFAPFTERDIQRVVYGIVGQRALRWERRIPPWNVVEIPLSTLPVGNHTVFIRVFDELGLKSAQTVGFTINASPTVVPTLVPALTPSVTLTAASIISESITPEPAPLGAFMAAIWSGLKSLLKLAWATRWQWVPSLIVLVGIGLGIWLARRHRNEEKDKQLSSGPITPSQKPAVLKRLSLDLMQPEVIPLREKHTPVLDGVFLITAETDDYYLAPGSDMIVIIKRNPSAYQKGDTAVDQTVKYPARVRLDSGQIIKAGEVEFIFYEIENAPVSMPARDLV